MPKLLGRIIETVNFVSPEIEIQGIDLSHPDYNNLNNWINGRYEILNGYIESLAQTNGVYPISTGEVVKEVSSADVNPFDLILPFFGTPRDERNLSSKQKITAIEHFNQFVTWRTNLRLIAQADLRKGKSWHLPIDGGATCYIDREGLIQVELDLFSQALQGVEISRIKECLICRRLFWAGRIDKKCCSDRCTNIYNTRQSRLNKQEKKDQYKIARIVKAERREAKAQSPSRK
ncbi:MAG TPA: hypothetical protein VJ464_24645 [Blastocatellia bacterium]|nr:hypothetical protein [Blastocatellia bacterium]